MSLILSVDVMNIYIQLFRWPMLLRRMVIIQKPRSSRTFYNTIVIYCMECWNSMLAGGKYKCLYFLFLFTHNNKNVPNVLNRSCTLTRRCRSRRRRFSCDDGIVEWRSGCGEWSVGWERGSVSVGGGRRRDVSGFSWVIGKFRQLTHPPKLSRWTFFREWRGRSSRTSGPKTPRSVSPTPPLPPWSSSSAAVASAVAGQQSSRGIWHGVPARCTCLCVVSPFTCHRQRVREKGHRDTAETSIAHCPYTVYRNSCRVIDRDHENPAPTTIFAIPPNTAQPSGIFLYHTITCTMRSRQADTRTPTL